MQKNLVNKFEKISDKILTQMFILSNIIEKIPLELLTILDEKLLVDLHVELQMQLEMKL